MCYRRGKDLSQLQQSMKGSGMPEKDAMPAAIAIPENVPPATPHESEAAAACEHGSSACSAAASEDGHVACKDIPAEALAAGPQAASAQPAQSLFGADNWEPDAADEYKQATGAELSPAGTRQPAVQAAVSTPQAAQETKRFTLDQRGVAAALLVVLKRALRDGHTLRTAKKALRHSAPLTGLFLAWLPDEGARLPSIRELEQSMNPVTLSMLSSLLAKQLQEDACRPLEVYTTAIDEGLAVLQNKKVRAISQLPLICR